jgi:phosphoenolpyruvate synthase/pyruvate phosphate dikinase
MNYRVDINQLKKISWYREGGAMAMFYIHIPYLGQFKGFNMKYGCFYSKELVGYGYYDKKAMEREARKVFDRQIKEKNYVDKIYKIWKKAHDNQNQFFKTLERVNFRSLSDEKLILLHRKFIKTRENLWGKTQYLLEAFNEYDLQFLNELQKKCAQIFASHEIKILTTPPVHTFNFQAKKELLSLYLKFKKGDKNFEKDLEQYTKKWFWLKNNWAFVYDLDKKHFLKELKSLNEKKLIEEIKKDEKYLSNVKKEQKRIIKHRKLHSQLKNYFYLLQKLGAWREERKKQTLTENGWADRFLREFSLRTKIDYHLLKNASPYFFTNKLKISKALLKNLETNELIVIGRDFKKWKIFYGKRARKIREIIEEVFAPKHKNVIEGKVANLGRAKGRVKIVFTYKDFSKVKPGDILVTQMTRPEFVPILKKVSAIITDEGGITCHAAIVSRELNIPCIIATQIATKVLKDGNLVEVDAEKGVVKILERTK